MYSRLLKNLLVPVLVLSLFLPIGLVLFPNTAEAQIELAGVGLPVKESGFSLWTQIKTTVESTYTAIKTGYLAFKAAVLDPLGWNLSAMILQAITAAIVDWINSGFQGSPAFVQSLENEFMNAANLTFESFLRSNDLQFLCYPQSIRISLITSYRSKFRQRAQCTITGVVSNLQGFMGGDWSKGGWQGFVSLAQEQNNPYAAKIMAQGELARRIATAVGIKDKKLQAGRLFKSFEICEDVDVVEDCPEAGAPCTGTRKQNTCRIGTPGAVLESQLNKALGLGQDKLVVADALDEILTALLAQLARMALTGSGGLYGLSNNSYGGGSPYTNQLASGSTSSGGGGQGGLLGAIDESIQAENDYREERKAILNLYAAPIGVEGKTLDIISCYTGKINSRTSPLNGNDLQTARARISAASSTLTNVILPKKIPLAVKVASSTEIISAFSLLKTNIQATTSAQAIADYATEYSVLSSKAHNRGDVVEAEREFNQESGNLYDATNSRPGDPLNGLPAKLENNLTECRAFPPTEQTGGGNN